MLPASYCLPFTCRGSHTFVNTAVITLWNRHPPSAWSSVSTALHKGHAESCVHGLSRSATRNFSIGLDKRNRVRMGRISTSKKDSILPETVAFLCVGLLRAWPESQTSPRPPARLKAWTSLWAAPEECTQSTAIYLLPGGSYFTEQFCIGQAVHKHVLDLCDPLSDQWRRGGYGSFIWAPLKRTWGILDSGIAVHAYTAYKCGSVGLWHWIQ